MSEKQLIKLYKDKVSIEFNPDTHRYTVNGKTGTPSVTSVTGLLHKPALIFWSANLGRDFLLEHFNAGKAITVELIIEAAKQHTIYKEKEATSGSLVHDFAEQYSKGLNPPMPEDERVVNGSTAFLDWVKKHKVKFIESEKVVYSLKHGYVGIADAIATIDKKTYLIDYKTGNGVYPEFYAQTAAYLKADAEESGRKYAGVKIVCFSKDTGEFKMEERTMLEVELDYQAFLGLLQVKKWLPKK